MTGFKKEANGFFAWLFIEGSGECIRNGFSRMELLVEWKLRSSGNS